MHKSRCSHCGSSHFHKIITTGLMNDSGIVSEIHVNKLYPGETKMPGEILFEKAHVENRLLFGRLFSCDNCGHAFFRVQVTPISFFNVPITAFQLIQPTRGAYPRKGPPSHSR